MFFEYLTGAIWLAQDLGGFGIPIWVWVILGTILLVVVIGLILSLRNSVKRSPSLRETNTREGTLFIPEASISHENNLEIPQTGIQTESSGLPTRTFGSAERRVDDQELTIIEGIDSAAQRVLYDAGITTFEKLAHQNIMDLKSILAHSGKRNADPTTWPEQARLAAAGRLKELRTWQRRLIDADRV